MIVTSIMTKLVFNVDYESGGDGTFTVNTGKVFRSSDSSVTLTAWDVDLQEALYPCSYLLHLTQGITLALQLLVFPDLFSLGLDPLPLSPTLTC